MKEKLLKNWVFGLILGLSILIVWPLFIPGYFSHHDDLQVMRIFEMRKCFEDFQIPCRWVPDMGYGNGFPLFNYYSVFPYYIGAILSFIFGFIGAAKVLFFIPLVLGGFSMFFLAQELFDRKVALISAVLYLFAPYRALDSYVRGAIAESFALALVPLVLYFLLRLCRNKSAGNFSGAILFLGAFLTSHNIMTIIFMPFILIMTFYFLYQEGFKNWKIVLMSLVLGFGLSIFFLVPAFFEKSLVQTDTLTRFDLDFRAHFVTISQLFFKNFWGYGASIPGPNDNLSFQIGWPHWPLVVIVLATFAARLIVKRSKTKNVVLVFLLGVTFLTSVFMTHNKSAFVWEKIGILRFAQFPWRFLSLSIFTASLLGGLMISFITHKKYQILFTVVIVVLITVLNWNFFRPEVFYTQMNDAKKLSGDEWKTQQKASVLDYLPRSAVEPKEAAPDHPLVNGETIINNFVNRSNLWQFQADVKKPSIIEMPVFDFPNWQVIVNGRVISHSHQNYLGRISFNLNPGSYLVTGQFTNTPIRLWSNIISLFSIISLMGILIYGKNKRFFD